MKRASIDWDAYLEDLRQKAQRVRLQYDRQQAARATCRLVAVRLLRVLYRGYCKTFGRADTGNIFVEAVNAEETNDG